MLFTTHTSLASRPLHHFVMYFWADFKSVGSPLKKKIKIKSTRLIILNEMALYGLCCCRVCFTAARKNNSTQEIIHNGYMNRMMDDNEPFVTRVFEFPTRCTLTQCILPELLFPQYQLEKKKKVTKRHRATLSVIIPPTSSRPTQSNEKQNKRDKKKKEKKPVTRSQRLSSAYTKETKWME